MAIRIFLSGKEVFSQFLAVLRTIWCIKLEKVVECSNKPVWNIPQVNRFIGNR